MSLNRAMGAGARVRNAWHVASAAGFDRSCVERLEPRTHLSADWSSYASAQEPTGPLEDVAGEFESMAWDGRSVGSKARSFVVQFDDAYGLDDARNLAHQLVNRLGVQAQRIEPIARGRFASITLASLPAEATIRLAAAGLSFVESIEPNAVGRASRLPDDTRYDSQWHHSNTGQDVPGSGIGTVDADSDVEEAWDTTIGDSSVIIGVIDSGIDFTHPDLASNIWTNPGEIAGNGLDDDGNGFIDDVSGWDFVNDDNNPQDDEGHGTSVAGMIGAVGNNGQGVAGVAWDVSLLALKAAGTSGNFLTEDTVAALDYLTMMIETYGHNIVASNNSYGGFGFSNADRASIQAFTNTGALFVAAAGNDALDNDAFPSYPGSYDLDGIINVASTNNDDALAASSTFGATTVDLAAPGEQVFTTQLGGIYGYSSGTSLAAPVVTGAIALLKSHRPGSSATEILDALYNSVDVLPSLQGRVATGGRLNVARAIQILGIDGPIVTDIDPGPVTSRTDPDTGLPIDTITVTFNKPIEPSTLDASSALLTFAGNDGLFGTGDDRDDLVPVADVALQAGATNVVEITLDLTGVPQQRLPLGHYRLTLFAGTSGDPAFQDTDGNLLNGNSSSGADERYDFEVIGVGGSLEPNDTTGTASPVAFSGSGEAKFTSLTLGDGLQAGLDVDLYRVTLPKGGLITAKIDARSLTIPSTLDSYLRLFDGTGNELASNDQFNGRDSYLDFFVATGGTYYVGVSGFGNDDYDPAIAGSGRTQSTGNYDLTITYARVSEDRITVAADLDEPLPVPAVGTQGVQSSTVQVTDGRTVKDVNVRFDLDHTFVSDLRISLLGPGGTEVILFDRHGGSGDDFNTVLLDDEAGTRIQDATPPYSGSLRPTNSLSALDGISAAGSWTLIIRDLSALNSGQLNSWSLELTVENLVNGPFESNDTISTAKELTEISGSGAASRDAQIGDGGFGALDRDLFRFTVDSGATFTATVDSLSSLDTALRLFDASGDEVKLSAPTGTRDSAIEGFVFVSGGTYYIAVSESGNTDYDPFDVTSGTAADTTGDYRLNITILPGVSDAPGVIAGDRIDAGFNSDGTFGTDDEDGNPVGARFDGVDFLLDSEDGSGLVSLYSATASGFDFLNDGSRGASSLPVSLINQSDARNKRLSVTGLFRDLTVERSVAYSIDDSFMVFDVTLINAGTGTISDLAWLEALDPNQGANLEDRGESTTNDVDSAGKYARASVSTNAFPQGATIALGVAAGESRAIATFVDLDVIALRDPTQVLDLGVVDPNDTGGDLAMALAFDLGSLDAGERTSIRYFVFFGDSPAEAQSLYDELNTGTGEGHLSADSADPITETLSNGDAAPTLPFRYYYPEGFSSSFIYTFVPMLNPHDQDTRVVVIARYETGQRDDVIADFTIEAQSRGGITTNTPEKFAIGFQNAGGSLVRPLAPYALEIRTERPIAATFSYYDTFLLDGERAAVGESFTQETSNTWTFGTVVKEPGRFDIPVFMNTSDQTIKVTTTLLPTGGGDEIVLTSELGAYRRGGWNLAAVDDVPEGSYAVLIEADAPIVAALSTYDSGETSGNVSASGSVGIVGIGSTSGVTPEGQLGLNSDAEIIGIANAGDEDAEVVFAFTFTGGSVYRTKVDVPARSRGELDVASLPNFPLGQGYSISFDSNQPVALSLPTQAFDDGLGTAFTGVGHTLWAFGEGFRPQNGFDQNVSEYLRVFNPSDTDTVVEITIRFDGVFEGTSDPLGQETFRRTALAGRVTEFNIHDFVTGLRREQDVFYGLTVKASTPIVAYVGHYDRFFPGAFGTLGVPLGFEGVI